MSLAHPLQLRRETFAQLEALVSELAEQGMRGLETVHSTHNSETRVRLTPGWRIGSNCSAPAAAITDGPHKPWIKLGQVGGQTIPRAVFDTIVGSLRPMAQPIIP